MATREELAQALAILGDTFGKKITKTTMQAYWMVCEEISRDALNLAVKRCLSSCKFMPTPAEIRERAGLVASKDHGELAWGCAIGAIHDPGYYGSVFFEDPYIPAVIRRLGGWEKFTDIPSEELFKWTRKDFLAMYAAIAGTPLSESPILIGYHDARNTGKFPEAVKPPKMIAAPYIAPEERAALPATQVKELADGS